MKNMVECFANAGLIQLGRHFLFRDGSEIVEIDALGCKDRTYVLWHQAVVKMRGDGEF